MSMRTVGLGALLSLLAGACEAATSGDPSSGAPCETDGTCNAPTSAAGGRKPSSDNADNAGNAAGAPGASVGDSGAPRSGDAAALPTSDSGRPGPGSPAACEGVVCSVNAQCNVSSNKCECSAGFALSGGECKAVVPGDPRAHSEAQVCDLWKLGHKVTASGSGWSGDASCNPGTLSQASVSDTVTRANMYRWLAGLGPVIESASQKATSMACAVVAAWNPSSGHSPQASAKCYTAAGAKGAGSSNLAWGNASPAESIDGYMEDPGNDTTFGHRAWLMNPKLGELGIGYYAGGGQYGNAQCLGVFDQSSKGPSPSWVSMPPAGYSPIEMTQWTWSFHSSGGDKAQMTVKRMSDGASLPMTRLPLQQGFGSYGVTAFRQQGWKPAVGQTYQVTVTGVGAAPISYDVIPAGCK
jgi:hypothetical protein